MKVGDLVKMRERHSIPGIIVRVDKDFFGAKQAFKISSVERGKCIRSDMVDIIAPTRDGIRHRVLVCWPDVGFSYEYSSDIEVINVQ